MDKNNVFEEKSISQLIFIFSLPTICSLILESLTAMIDTAFAGHLGVMSGAALAAMGLLSPVLLILIAAQLIFGVSTSIVISKRLGENDSNKINHTFKVGFYASCFFSSLISLVVYLLQNQLLVGLGASGEVLIFAKQYLNIALIFNIFSSVGYMLVNNIRAFGYPKIEMIIGVTATLINVIFNIIFTFGFKLGIVGIALSTLVSEIYYLSFATIFLIRKKMWIKKSSLPLHETKEILFSLVKIGFVQFLMQALGSVSSLIINQVLIRYGNYSYIGAWAVVSNINMAILLPLIGLTQGVQSVLAYFHGSNEVEKENQVKSKIVKYGMIYSIFMTLLILLFANQVTYIFTMDKEVIHLAADILKMIALGFPFLGIMYTLITFMQVSGHENSASRLGFIREVVLVIPLIICFSYLAARVETLNQSLMFVAIPLANMLIVLIFHKQVRGLFQIHSDNK